MREILKKIDWVYYAIFTFALVMAYFVTGIVTVEIPELPWWYSLSASVGMTLTILSVLVTIRLVFMVGYRIVKNALAAGNGVP